MTASITEYSHSASIVIVEDGEHHVVDIMETDSCEELGQVDYELFHGHAVFNYSLLGDPNADSEEISEVYECEDGYA